MPWMKTAFKMKLRFAVWFGWGCLSLAPWLLGESAGDTVVVVYNRRLPESKGLAEYYADRRQVPAGQVFGFDLPTSENMTRTEYQNQLQKPLLLALEQANLMTFVNELRPASRERPGEVLRRVAQSKVRYAALCYGVPVRIMRDTNIVETGQDKVRVELRRNEAAVDSELACLPLVGVKLPLFGPLSNRYYGTTNAAIFHPTNGLLLVSRLDGPSVEIARGLIDKAMQAETNGLWGRAYFDARGITNGEYKMGDDWMRGAAQTARRLGFETVLDDKPETFSAGFPMSQIAIYFGWYDGGVTGPFTLPQVEFMPGAIAYHLFSFSAASIRTSQHWVGALLSKGATATMGSVDEPYLMGTPDLAVFLDRLVHGFTLGEAAYAGSSTLSWQTTVVGDPLYQPFGNKPQTLHEELVQRKSKWVEWSHLRVVNLNLNTGTPMGELIQYLQQLPETRTSAVLQEKLADLYHASGKLGEAIEEYPKVLALNPTRQQRIRVILNQCRILATFGHESQAWEDYQRFTREFPDYPDLLGIYRRMLPLAEQLGKTAEVEKLKADINRLAPPPPVPPKA
jgi:uncharacterized protein (TIGR03790 family)